MLLIALFSRTGHIVLQSKTYYTIDREADLWLKIYSFAFLFFLTR